MRFTLVALLLASRAAVAGTAPEKAQTPPDETWTVECTFANPSYSGPCAVSEKVSQKLSPRVACTEILSCLNSSQCIKSYCNATTVRGGWTLLKADRRPTGPPTGTAPPPVASPAPTPHSR